jgi:hypothetical protein
VLGEGLAKEKKDFASEVAKAIESSEDQDKDKEKDKDKNKK